MDDYNLIEGSTQLGLAYVLLNSELSKRVLGPTSDYLGDELKLFTQKRINNIKRIFENADKKMNVEKGSVPPKVLRSIINEGSYCDDDLSVEYFGGLLASSKSEISRDDRGTYYASMVMNLSAYQIRTHYIFYHTVKELFDGTELNIGIERERKKMIVYMPMDEYSAAMDFAEKEDKNTIVAHSIVGLIKESLLDKYYAIIGSDVIKEFSDEIEKPGVVFQPSSIGVELFIWAHGRKDLSVQEFFNPENKFKFADEIYKPQNCLITEGIN